MRTLILIALLAFVNCGNKSEIPFSHSSSVGSGETLRSRIAPPKGYSWVDEEEGSFAEFLQGVKLKEKGSKILDYRNNPIDNQYEHIAIMDFDVGSKDLQQCADAVIRLRTEYLWEKQRHDDIAFHFTSGHLFKWNDYKKGLRPKVSGNKVSFLPAGPRDESYAALRRYLDWIFMYAGTISVFRETTPVTADHHIEPGQIIINPGSPGHTAIIAGRARNAKGHTVYLLAQGYMPAQSIHVLTNPFNNALNPWYDISTSNSQTKTARYTFYDTNIRSYD